MKQKIIQTLKILLFLAVGLFLFWWVYKDVPMEKIKAGLRNINYLWIWVSLALGTISHISRAMRWNMLIETLGKTSRLPNTFMAVMVGYLANLAVPRLGEVSRCGMLTRYEKISFTRLIGTVVIERAMDMVVLLGLLLAVILTQTPELLLFLENNPEVETNIRGLVQSKGLLIFAGAAVVASLAAFFLFRDYLRQLKVYQKVKNMMLGFWDGIKSVRYVRQKAWFIFHSLLIWLLYYLMMYVTFFAFDFTSDYGPLVGLTVFVMGSFGMVAPVQGGLGAWHFMVIATFFVFGLADADARIFALVVHGSMTLLLVVLGLLSLVLFPILNARYEKEETWILSGKPK